MHFLGYRDPIYLIFSCISVIVFLFLKNASNLLIFLRKVTIIAKFQMWSNKCGEWGEKPSLLHCISRFYMIFWIPVVISHNGTILPNIIQLFKKKLFILFIYFWLCCIFVAAHRLSLVAASGGYSLLWCMGFSLWWLLLLWIMSSSHAGFSSCGSQALEHRLSSCGAWA